VYLSTQEYFHVKETTQVALLCRREPRDALCPPVVSSDSVIPRVQSFIIT